MKKIISILIVMLLFGCNNIKTEIPQEDLSGEIINVCKDSVLTQWLDGNWYRNVKFNFKITNYSKHIYYTKLDDSNSLFCNNYTEYFKNGDSLRTPFVCIFTNNHKDSILPNETKNYFTVFGAIELRKNIARLKNNYAFFTKTNDSIFEYHVPLTFDLTKVVNCK